MTAGRKSGEARRALRAAAPFECCAVCGLTVAASLTVAHNFSRKECHTPCISRAA
jgi:hypothetical protein